MADMLPPTKSREYLNFWQIICLSYNYFIGTGLLALPWAFARTGVAIGIFIVLLFGVYMYLGIYVLIAVIQRTKVLIYLDELSPEAKFRIASEDHNEEVDESEKLIMQKQPELTITLAELYKVHDVDRRFEMTELCHRYLGSGLFGFFVFNHTLFLFFSLWVYAATFANTMETLLPMNDISYAYKGYIAIFAVLVVPASLVEFTDIIWFELLVTALLMIVIVTMICTVLAAYGTGGDPFGTDDTFGGYSSLLKFDLSQLQVLLPIVAYAYPPISAIPTLEYDLEDKSDLSNLFAVLVGIVVFSFLALSVILSCYFGEAGDYLTSLNWEYYTASVTDTSTWYGSVISVFVVSVQAVNMLSSYPLFANALGNNLASAVYGDHELTLPQLQMFRGLAAAVPLIWAFWVADLGEIVNYAGVLLFGVNFIFPGLLLHYSRRVMEEKGYKVPLVLSSQTDEESLAWSLVVSGCILAVTVPICLAATS